ncbi:hypothetical protein ACFPVT_07155 [Corynebacterium choanae]|uniref:Uncharacterized protein n=1 Tax=Corynebacterium choanae TaxID=1862358 RepID=A0A3G6JB87_9CORY|nr:hypothetical protein [Corynebacterium choanae]AZA13870.1 hypothetical protein CCHOA_07390 [Corynebacterium choanae]
MLSLSTYRPNLRRNQTAATLCYEQQGAMIRQENVRYPKAEADLLVEYPAHELAVVAVKTLIRPPTDGRVPLSSGYFAQLARAGKRLAGVHSASSVRLDVVGVMPDCSAEVLSPFWIDAVAAFPSRVIAASTHTRGVTLTQLAQVNNSLPVLPEADESSRYCAHTVQLWRLATSRTALWCWQWQEVFAPCTAKLSR